MTPTALSSPGSTPLFDSRTVADVLEWVQPTLVQPSPLEDVVSLLSGTNGLIVGLFITLGYVLVVHPWLTPSDATGDDRGSPLDRGWTGLALQRVTPVAGTVDVDGEPCPARTRRGVIEAGETVEVVGYTGDGTAVVECCAPAADDSGDSSRTTERSPSGSGGADGDASEPVTQGSGRTRTYELTTRDGARLVVEVVPDPDDGSTSPRRDERVLTALGAVVEAIERTDGPSGTPGQKRLREFAREQGLRIDDATVLEPGADTESR